MKETILAYSQGQSLGQISRLTGIPKTTVKRFVDQAGATGMSVEAILTMPDEDVTKLLTPSRRARLNYDEPDWEMVYLRYERPRKPWDLQACWREYCNRPTPQGKTMGYSSFCRAYNEYKKNLPTSMTAVSMSFQWTPGDVAMIDYSGDPLYFVEPSGKRHKAEIFVGVMPYSNYIFCVATLDQTRRSWLAGCKRMLEFFGGVPQYVFLDNSTSLVTKADLYEPEYCADFKGLAAYYGFSPMAVRPGKLRDKAAVEGAVGLVQRRITNQLSGMKFLSLDDVNAIIRPLLEELNQRPLSEKSGTRQELFEKDEKPVMQTLPAIPYELGMFEKTLKVRQDYQIRLHNRRFSVPYTYAGKLVKVRCWSQKNLLAVYDLQTGKEIARHHYDGNSAVVLVKREHMPVNHLMQLRTKDDLLQHLRGVGPHSYELGQHLTRNQRELVARKNLSGMLASARNAGYELAEAVAHAVLNRPEATFKLYREELNRRIGASTTEISLGRGVQMSVDKESKNMRGAKYYADRLCKGKEK